MLPHGIKGGMIKVNRIRGTCVHWPDPYHAKFHCAPPKSV